MSQQALDYFNKAQSMLVMLHGSISSYLINMDELEKARLDNERVLLLLSAVEPPDDEFKEGLERVRLKLDGNERGIETYSTLINIAAGAILQIAKQALSIAHGKQKNCKEGRKVSGTCVRDLVWYGRNQAMHYEETRLEDELDENGNVVDRHYRSNWVGTFQRLHDQQNSRFIMEYPFKSLAKDVLDELGWTFSYTRLESDIRELISGSASRGIES
ncbi:hypothetical protein SB11R_14490 [Pseudomonas oryzihabitans]|nr:hypothetical protein SB11R_14490 [Pseudomonas psychrotolerans]